MICIFEGPRCSGKSTISHSLVEHLKADELPAEWWKSKRGDDPFGDMIATIHLDFGDKSKLWVVDRFHLSEYVNSKASRRGTSHYVAELKQQIWHIDRLMRDRNALIIYPVVSLATRKGRLKRKNKKDPIDGALMEALWAQAILESRCERIAVYSEHSTDLYQTGIILFDLVKARWDRRLG